MLTIPDDFVIVLLTVGASLLFLWLLQRVWPIEQRRQHNDLIGWHITVLGTTYAVIIGFMLFAVWENFEVADGNAVAEANALVNVVRSARGLPAPAKDQLYTLAKQYVDVMLTQEWPAMNEGKLAPASHRIMQDLWKTITDIETHSGREQTSLDHTFTELSNMTGHRRIRELEVTSALPGILWAVLVIGAVVTIISASLFGSADFRLHVIQVVMLSLMLSSVLVAIADINRPFQGSVHVGAQAFERARITLQDPSWQTP